MVSRIGWLEQSLPGEQSTKSLVEVARDQPAAFDTIYYRYRQPLYAYVRARVENEEDALDIVQEVFLRAFRGLARYEHREDAGDSPFTAWLFRIARNAVIDHHRRGRATMSLETLPERCEPSAAGDLEIDAVRREAVIRVMQAVSALPAAKQDLLALRFAAGLHVPEIARIIGKSEAATRKEILRLLQKLRKYCHDL
jgi:RNA polymerase sigma-70 factor (ECF subfamily)